MPLAGVPAGGRGLAVPAVAQARRPARWPRSPPAGTGRRPPRLAAGATVDPLRTPADACPLLPRWHVVRSIGDGRECQQIAWQIGSAANGRARRCCCTGRGWARWRRRRRCGRRVQQDAAPAVAAAGGGGGTGGVPQAAGERSTACTCCADAGAQGVRFPHGAGAAAESLRAEAGKPDAEWDHYW